MNIQQLIEENNKLRDENVSFRKQLLARNKQEFEQLLTHARRGAKAYQQISDAILKIDDQLKALNEKSQTEGANKMSLIDRDAMPKPEAFSCIEELINRRRCLSELLDYAFIDPEARRRIITRIDQIDKELAELATSIYLVRHPPEPPKEPVNLCAPDKPCNPTIDSIAREVSRLACSVSNLSFSVSARVGLPSLEHIPCDSKPCGGNNVASQLEEILSVLRETECILRETSDFLGGPSGANSANS